MDTKAMFGDAKWCATDKECTSPYIRKTFELDKVLPAQIRICGLGFFELYINGKKVSDDMLVPSYTQYEERDFHGRYDFKGKMGCRICVCRYDVTEYLKVGKNALAVRLGKGWYDLGEDWITYGKEKLCFNLTIGNMHILSDETLKWKQSDIINNSIYIGEEIDADLSLPLFADSELDDADWKNVHIVPAPETHFEFQTAPADKIIRKITPVLLKDNGKYSIYDVKEAVSGFAAIKCLEAGKTIRVRFADALTENGELDFQPTGGKIQQDVVYHGKVGECYTPRFTWHGFRYIEITDNAAIEKVNVLHADCAVTSDFTCDNEVLNWLYQAYIRTQLDNMHCGIPSDCPHIERHGYTGDGQLCCPAAMMMLDAKEFYRKWMKDIADSQEKDTGHVQHTAPFVGGGGGPAAWGGAIITVPYTFYRMYGEKEVLETYYPHMMKYVEYMISRSENGLVWREEKDWCLGDWCAPTEYLLPEKHLKSRLQIPETYVNTALFVKYMMLLKDIGAVLNREKETEKLDTYIANAKRMLEVAYYSPMTKDFCGNVQGANGFAVDIGLGGRDTVISTCEKYRLRGMPDTGIMATDVIPRILFENGYEQTAFDFLSSRGDVSFGYMMEHGATTIWEDWHPERSLNHPMFGAATRYLFEYILGIRQTEQSVAYQNVVIEPKLVKGLNRAKGYITTEQGKIAVAYNIWRNEAGFEIEIPENVNAVFINQGKSRTLHTGVNRFKIDI